MLTDLEGSDSDKTISANVPGFDNPVRKEENCPKIVGKKPTFYATFGNNIQI